jgi:hypothetical protein
LLVVSACTSAPAQYTGVQSRTAIDKIPAGGQMKNFELVANNQLIDSRFNVPRGSNGGMTALRDCVYVGSNSGIQPTLILDMKDMTKPTVVGELPGIPGQSMAGEAIEGVADLNLLVNTAQNSKNQYGDYKFPVSKADSTIGAIVYDATDCRKPTIVAKIDVQNVRTHYMSMWRDIKKQDRVLMSISYSSTEDGVDIRVWDLTGCPKTCNPKVVGEWGLNAQLGVPQSIVTKYEGGQRTDGTTTHDHTFSMDGTRIHMAQNQYGYFQIDSSALASGQPCNAKAARSPDAKGHCLTTFPNFKPIVSFGVETASVHGVVSIPGKPYVVLHHEGGNCPYAGLTFAYIGSRDEYNQVDKTTGEILSPTTSVCPYRADLFPRRNGSFAITENDISRCPKPGDTPPATTGATGMLGRDSLLERKDVHNSIAFPNLLFATWYGGGLRAVDISNPFSPFELGFFFNKPPVEVRWCDDRSGACADAEVDAEGTPIRQKNTTPPGIIARSYPITMNGYVVYSDSNSGLFVLKYTGPHAEEIPQKGNCLSRSPSIVALGYEPCPPYKSWSP